MGRTVFALLFLGFSVVAASANELTAAMFDATSPPTNLPSSKAIKAQWTAYQHAKACFEHPTYMAGTSYKLAILDPDAFRQQTSTLFAGAPGNDACKPFTDAGTPPKPIAVVKLDESYGEQIGAVSLAYNWIQWALAAYRFEPTPALAAPLKQMLIDWAGANALRKGINVSWGAKPVDWQMMTFITAILQVYTEVRPEMTADERAEVGPWLNRLTAKILLGHWKDESDNKAYQTTLVSALWGTAVGDKKAVQHAIDVFKLGINMMRPDGSQPIDTQRSGMGLHYNLISTGNLFMIAAVLKRTLGIDLFAYQVDGRSIHTAIEFVAATIKDPSLNKTYAISCPDGGDRFGSIDHPGLNALSIKSDFNAGYLLAYADLFPERDVSMWVRKRFANAFDRWHASQPFGASPQCMLAAK